jgi:rhodanese-related sulfurtransferase
MDVINVIDGKKMIDENLGKDDFELIDVRSPLEYKQGHIRGSKLIPLEELEKYVEDFDDKKTYLLYCRTGGRSGFAQKMLSSKGLIAINMMGGIVDWSEEGYHVEK